MKLSEYLYPELICTRLAATTKADVLAELGELLAKPGGAGAGAITSALLEREKLATTGIGDHVAIPHAKLGDLDGNRIAIGISPKGIDFDAIDGEPVRILFALIAPLSSSGDHLRILAQISRLLKDSTIRKNLINASDTKAFISIIRQEEGK